MSWLLRAAAPMLVARLVVGGVYLWFGINKLLEPVAFLKALREYEMLPLDPPQMMNLTVVILPWLEILCGLALLVGLWLRAAGSLLLSMTLVFTVAIAMRGVAEAAAGGIGFCEVSFDCGCGVGVVQVCPKLAENLGLILLAALTVASRSRALSWGPRSRTAA